MSARHTKIPAWQAFSRTGLLENGLATSPDEAPSRARAKSFRMAASHTFYNMLIVRENSRYAYSHHNSFAHL